MCIVHRSNRRHPGIRIAAKRHKKAQKKNHEQKISRQGKTETKLIHSKVTNATKTEYLNRKPLHCVLCDLLWDWSCIFFELFVPLGGYSLFLLSAKGPLFCQSPHSDRSVVYVALRTEAESSRCI